MGKLLLFYSFGVVLLGVLLIYPVDPDVSIAPIVRKEASFRGSAPSPHPAIKKSEAWIPSTSKNDKIHAWIYAPKFFVESSKFPLIIMAHGIGGQKDFGLEKYAVEFVLNESIVVIFDYRHFGGSDGSPRNLIDPARLVDDWISVIRFVFEEAAKPNSSIDLDKIGLWGTSFAGGHVLSSMAELIDKGIVEYYPKCIVSQVPHLNGFKTSIRSIRKRGLFLTLRFLMAGIQDVFRDFLGMSPAYIPISGRQHQLSLMSLDDESLASYFSKIPKPEARLGGWENRAPARIGFYLRKYSPILRLKRSVIPFIHKNLLSHKKNATPRFLFIGADRDDLCPIEDIKEALQIFPVVDSIHPPIAHLFSRNASHFDIYHGEHFRQLITHTTEFFYDCFNAVSSPETT